jgi:hypothetical protein
VRELPANAAEVFVPFTGGLFRRLLNGWILVLVAVLLLVVPDTPMVMRILGPTFLVGIVVLAELHRRSMRVEIDEHRVFVRSWWRWAHFDSRSTCRTETFGLYRGNHTNLVLKGDGLRRRVPLNFFEPADAHRLEDLVHELIGRG